MAGGKIENTMEKTTSPWPFTLAHMTLSVMGGWVVDDDFRGLLIVGTERYPWGKTKSALNRHQKI